MYLHNIIVTANKAYFSIYTSSPTPYTSLNDFLEDGKTYNIYGLILYDGYQSKDNFYMIDAMYSFGEVRFQKTSGGYTAIGNFACTDTVIEL